MEIRCQLIDLSAGREKRVEGRPGILGLEERTPVGAGGPCKEDVRVGIQPSHNPNPAEHSTVGFPQDRPAASRQDNPLHAHKAAQSFRLGVPKSLLSSLGENLGDAAVFGLRHQLIAIDKSVAGQVGKAPADG